MYKLAVIVLLAAVFGSTLGDKYSHSHQAYGVWGYWGEWSDCTKECGSGSQTRTRECRRPQYHHGSHGSHGSHGECYGDASETRECNTQLCPVDGAWADWVNFTMCSATCGGGERTRERTCTNPSPAHGGADCNGDSSETEACNEQECPVDGAWADWGKFTMCSATCGGGEKTRERTCTNPAPAHGGANCEGDSSETEACNEQGCPVDGAWTEWGQFGDCSVKCGHGTKNRTRTCTNPEPANGGKDCYGDDTDTTYCYIYKCPVDGRWSHWTYWSSCSGNCGEGLRVRSRSCNYPAPANGGKDCEGENSETETCKHYRQCYHGYQPSGYGHRDGYGYQYGPYSQQYHQHGYGIH